MASNIKRGACAALAEYLAPLLAPVPVYGDIGEYEQDQVYPAVVVTPQPFTFTPQQEEELDTRLHDRLLVQVGEYEGTVELRCYEMHLHKREELEQAVLDIIHVGDGELASGLITVPVKGLTFRGASYLHEPRAAFVLTDEQWRNEMVFASEVYAYLSLDAMIPALASREGIYSVETLVSALAAGVDDSVLTAESPTVENVTVNLDGSISNT